MDSNFDGVKIRLDMQMQILNQVHKKLKVLFALLYEDGQRDLKNKTDQMMNMSEHLLFEIGSMDRKVDKRMKQDERIRQKSSPQGVKTTTRGLKESNLLTREVTSELIEEASTPDEEGIEYDHIKIEDY